jgi:16S rRNA processing protein RimM
MEWDDLILVGRIARAHGNRGEVVVNPETDFPEERFREGSALHVRRGGRIETLTIASARVQRGRPVLRLRGVDSMDDAEALAGAELRIAAGAARPLAEGQYYRHELVGCRVETTGGDTIGTVRAIESSGGADRLVVEGAHGEVLVPLARDICVVIEPRERRIVIDPPEGLLDLNR